MRVLLSVLAFTIFNFHVSHAQWTHMDGPGGFAGINEMFVAGDTIFVATQNGVIRSVNGGTQWSAINQGLPVRDVRHVIRTSFGIFAATEHGAFRFNRNTVTWEPVNEGINTNVYCFSQHYVDFVPTELYAGTANGVYVFDSSTGSWSPRNEGLQGKHIYRLKTDFQGRLYANASESPILYSEDNGLSWEQTNFPNSGPVVAMHCFMSGVFVNISDPSALYISMDGGETYAEPETNNQFFVTDIVSNGMQWFTTKRYIGPPNPNFVVSPGGIGRSDDFGSTWTSLTNGVPTATTYIRIALDELNAGGVIYVISTDGKLLKTTNSGNTWSQVSTIPLPKNANFVPQGIVVAKEDRLVTASDNRIYSEDQNESTWNAGMQMANSLFVNFVSLNDTLISVYNSTDNLQAHQLYYSVNNGLTQMSSTGFPDGYIVDFMWHNGSDVFLKATNYSEWEVNSIMMRSSNNGVSWQLWEIDIISSANSIYNGLSFQDGGILLISESQSSWLPVAYYSQDNGASWQEVDDLDLEVDYLNSEYNPMTTYSNMLIGKGFGIELLYSTDFGKNWNLIPGNLPDDFNIMTIQTFGFDIFVGGYVNLPITGYTARIYRKQSLLADWEDLSDGLPINSNIERIQVNSNGKIYVDAKGVWHTSVQLSDGETSGITELIEFSNGLIVYPNPSVGVFVLESELLGAHYSIQDVQGRVVTTGTVQHNVTELNLTLEARGIYFLSINNQVVKLVKE
jgi:photosystem II stability/assembly factor-like uncharacterized protein